MPMDPSRYPDDWTQISYNIRFVRADGRCECTGECGLHHGRCNAEHGLPHPITDSKVVLTTAHLGAALPDGTSGNKHDKMDVRPENLKAMCQRCHLIFDLDDHIAHARTTRTTNERLALLEAGQMEMEL